ncbi:hypothetical protein [Pseudarthrobacter sp. BIM B-2242]|uniref:hypothetical protein n=1 Tax=Pseudarthrobacter sp. BIM B-2242 TaxID=2772401 RepID=UPI00168BA13C|nr:hypothetical protein [Pseudarthrobacter sp. BIM B-2242]QOD06009.1 hypothetical protein IDT60_20815 [Pseudarthrobacter sp. BIM B-2242]
MTSTPSRPSATDETDLAVCNCRKASHNHGTRDMYGYHRCRCLPCRAANRDYFRSTAHLTRTLEWADAEPVRQRLLQLREAGLTFQAISDLSGLQITALKTVLKGPNGRTVKRVLASTADAINAVSYKDIAAYSPTDKTRIEGSVARLQTMALQAAGWCSEDLAERSGVGKQTFNRLLRGLGTTEEMRRQIDALYQELRWTDPPQDTPLQRTRVRRALRRAAENGWTTTMVEDAEYGEYDEEAA